MLQMREHSQKLTHDLFQNVVLYFESYWKQENVAGINFWDFNKLNDWASKSEQEIDCSWQWHVADTP